MAADEVKPDGKAELSRAEEIKLESAREEDARGEAIAQHDTFRMVGKNMRHYVAHAEYGVVFSLCGMRVSGGSLEMNAAVVDDEILCEKCKVHIHK